MKLPFLSFTAHSRRNLTHAQRCTVPEAAYFYYTIKGGVSTRFILHENYFFHTFRNIFPGGKQKAFRYFTYILHYTISDAVCLRLPGQLFHGLAHRIGRKQEHTTAGVYLHMTAHITQLKILHGVSLLCVCFIPGTSPVNTVSHNKDTIKRTFKCFCRLFAQKSDDSPRSAPPLSAATPLGNRGFGSSPSQRRISAGNRRRSCRFPSRPPPVKMG